MLGSALLVATLVIAGLILGIGALLGASEPADDAVGATASPTAAARPPAPASTVTAPQASTPPSPTATAAETDPPASASAPAGSEGACTASIKNLKIKDDEFDLEIEIHARAGGVDAWQVTVDLGDALATQADHATLVDQTDGIVAIQSEEDAKGIDSGKRFTFKVKGQGQPSGLQIACAA